MGRSLDELNKVLDEVQDFKSQLVEYSQKEKIDFKFEHQQINREIGLYYTVKLFLNNKEVAKGEGSSKKKAEQMAAKNFFENSK